MTLRAYRGGIASMATLIPGIGTSADKLHAELRTLIASSRQRLAGEVNAELTRLYWHVGQRLRRMLQFAVAFPDTARVASLMRHLSWTHFLQLLPVKTDVARWFYASQATTNTDLSFNHPRQIASRLGNKK